MGGVNNPKLSCYTIPFSAGLSSPADAAVQVFGGVASIAPAGVDYYICLCPKAGRLTRVDTVIWVAGTLGTTETGTIAVRQNETTDTTLTSSAQWNTTRQSYSINLASPLTIAAGDKLEIKITCPTWATNPTNVLYGGTFFIEGVASS